jgi:hypothetical protein
MPPTSLSGGASEPTSRTGRAAGRFMRPPPGGLAEEEEEEDQAEGRGVEWGRAVAATLLGRMENPLYLNVYISILVRFMSSVPLPPCRTAKNQ